MKKKPEEGVYYQLTCKLNSKGTTHKINDCFIKDGVWYRRRYFRYDDGTPSDNKLIGWDPIPIDENDISVLKWDKQAIQNYDDLGLDEIRVN